MVPRRRFTGEARRLQPGQRLYGDSPERVLHLGADSKRNERSDQVKRREERVLSDVHS